MAEKRDFNITINKSGGTAVNGITYRATIPTNWAVKLGFSPDDRPGEMEFDEDEEFIKIRKKKN